MFEGDYTNHLELVDRIRRAQTIEDAESFAPIAAEHFQSVRMSGGADWNYSIYDTAWIVASRVLPEEERIRFLITIEGEQNPNGSWGDPQSMPHHRLVDSLAIAMAFVRNGYFIPREEKLAHEVDRLLRSARDYPYHDTVGFEIIVPLLIKWLERHSFPLALSAESWGYVDHLYAACNAKLEAMAKGPGLFGPGGTLSYTAEYAALMPLASRYLDQATDLILSNGSVQMCPSATAGVAIALQENGRDVPAALTNYLWEVYHRFYEQGFPQVYPYSNYQRLWNVLPWLLSGNLYHVANSEAVLAVLKQMYLEIVTDEEGRVGWDEHSPYLPDLDDTAATFALYAFLTSMNVRVREQPLSSFEHFRRNDGSFFCYPLETHGSFVSHMHTLLALDIAEGAFGPEFTEQEQVTSMRTSLLNGLAPGTMPVDQLCHDKWHSSWTYGANRWMSVRSARHAYPDVVTGVVEYALHRQNGGWSENGAPTLEETAYVTSGLAIVLQCDDLGLPQSTKTEIWQALQRAKRFMTEEAASQPRIPPLYIAKNLYRPFHHVVSVMLDAQLSLLQVEQMWQSHAV